MMKIIKVKVKVKVNECICAATKHRAARKA